MTLPYPKKTTSYVFLFVSLLLYGSHLLLPLDRGFPNISLSGFMINSSMLISFICFALVFLEDPHRTINIFLKPYPANQLFIFLLFVISALRSETTITSLRIALVYLATFVINYVIVTRLIILCSYRSIWIIIISVVTLASAIGIVEGIFSLPIPIYEYWENTPSGEVTDLITKQLRVDGTLGNPIIYGVAMMLSIPFILEIKNKILRCTLVVIIFISALLTISRTVLMMAVIYIIGWLWVNRTRSLQLAVYILLIVTLTFGIVLKYSDEISNNFHVSAWLQRLNIIESENSEYARSGISARSTAITEAFDGIFEGSLLDLFFGHGALADVEIAGKISKNYNTLDNAFFTLAYNDGIIALIVFLLCYKGVFVSSLTYTQKMHQLNIIALLTCSFSFVFYAYATCNILTVTSLVLINNIYVVKANADMY